MLCIMCLGRILGLDVIDCVRRLHLDGDGIAGEGLHTRELVYNQWGAKVQLGRAVDSF